MLINFLRTDNLALLVIGLCPLALIATSTAHSVAMGAVFFVVLLFTTIFLSLLRHWVPYAMRLTMLLIVVAFVVTLIELFMRAFYYEWYLILGIYIPLLSMNCLILADAEENVLVNTLKVALCKNLVTGLCICGILLAVGSIREYLPLAVFGKDNFGMFSFAPSTFFVLGLIMALIQYINIKYN